MSWLKAFSAGEKQVLGAILLTALAGSGVAWVRHLRPEWFIGAPPVTGTRSLMETAEPTAPTQPVETPESAETPPTEGNDSTSEAIPPMASSDEPRLPPEPSPSAVGATSPSAAAESGELIHLNRADVATLERLPGIGPQLAQRIVAYRQEVGGFRSVEELIEVRGIGEKTLAKLRPLVTVEP